MEMLLITTQWITLSFEWLAQATYLHQLVVVLLAIFIGARVGGIGLGIFGMMGMAILVFYFGLEPGKAPIESDADDCCRNYRSFGITSSRRFRLSGTGS
ncbi:hypothetical protein CCAN2_1720009 [Capnocytophaga canimorsus]|nr:hypothetical protein CCAN2_1720009 [Capnocytophaga canimorsus]